MAQRHHFAWRDHCSIHEEMSHHSFTLAYAYSNVVSVHHFAHEGQYSQSIHSDSTAWVTTYDNSLASTKEVKQPPSQQRIIRYVDERRCDLVHSERLLCLVEQKPPLLKCMVAPPRQPLLLMTLLSFCLWLLIPPQLVYEPLSVRQLIHQAHAVRMLQEMGLQPQDLCMQQIDQTHACSLRLDARVGAQVACSLCKAECRNRLLHGRHTRSKRRKDASP
mmetsp:Transcript_4629/g.11209  ORF Transcript_4629/g.11209 Transcript_4629/m.11209 type:complete len:219 (-) Transcript_4629:1306-1962(-)